MVNVNWNRLEYLNMDTHLSSSCFRLLPSKTCTESWWWHTCTCGITVKMAYMYMGDDRKDGNHFLLVLEWERESPQVALSTLSCLVFLSPLCLSPGRQVLPTTFLQVVPIHDRNRCETSKLKHVRINPQDQEHLSRTSHSSFPDKSVCFKSSPF